MCLCYALHSFCAWARRKWLPSSRLRTRSQLARSPCAWMARSQRNRRAFARLLASRASAQACVICLKALHSSATCGPIGWLEMCKKARGSTTRSAAVEPWLNQTNRAARVVRATANASCCAQDLGPALHFLRLRTRLPSRDLLASHAYAACTRCICSWCADIWSLRVELGVRERD